MLTLVNHPWLLEEHCEEGAALHLTAPPLMRLRDALLGELGEGSQRLGVGQRAAGRRAAGDPR